MFETPKTSQLFSDLEDHPSPDVRRRLTQVRETLQVALELIGRADCEPQTRRENLDDIADLLASASFAVAALAHAHKHGI